MKTNEIFNEFPNLTLDSNLLDIEDMWDLLYFFIKCEENFGIQIFDLEVEILERKNVKISEVFEYFDFLKNEKLTKFVNDFYIENKNDLIGVRQKEIESIRDKKINDLIKKSS
jgi:hypothetical protein